MTSSHIDSYIPEIYKATNTSCNENCWFYLKSTLLNFAGLIQPQYLIFSDELHLISVRLAHSYSQANGKRTCWIMLSVKKIDWCSLVKACINHLPSLTGLINTVLRIKSKHTSAVDLMYEGLLAPLTFSTPRWRSAEITFRFISTWKQGKGIWKIS